MKRFISYLKYFYFLDDKELREQALGSWRQYIVGKARIYDVDFCRAYQRAFMSKRRHDYAMSKINES
jgi:hypothetical protein